MEEKINRIIKKAASRKDIFGVVFYVSSGDKRLNIIKGAGNLKEDSRYYIASINKFFVSAIVLKLCVEKKLNLDDKISKYLPTGVIQGLHLHKGRDYSDSITIRHLISLTSGLPCYLTDKQANGKIAIKELEVGIDQAWSIDKVIREVKKMKTHFPPGKQGKAKYSDTNHHILGLIAEKVLNKPLNMILENLFKELGMTKTYVCEDIDDKKYAPIYFKSKIIYLPSFLTSTKYDIISTARDQMVFLKAFFRGHFFPKERLHELERWNKIFFPFKYGIGIQKFSIPYILSPFYPVPDMIGHCGSTGTVAFYIPRNDIYITGTVNQQSKPNIAFQTMIKITKELKR